MYPSFKSNKHKITINNYYPRYCLNSIRAILIFIFILNVNILLIQNIDNLLTDPDQNNKYNQIIIRDREEVKIESKSASSSSTTTRQAIIFRITSLTSFEINDVGMEVETDKFYIGNTMNVKCNVSHDKGPENITEAEITIFKESDNSILLQYEKMEESHNLYGPTWKWFNYSYIIPDDTERTTYIVMVQVKSKSLGTSEINSSISIEILNQPPKIKDSIIPILKKYESKKEDDPPWTINLATFKTDLEDSGDNLIWKLENVNKSLLNIDINYDILSFHLIPNAFGNNQLTLVLEDSDHGMDSIKFWINISSENDPPKITPTIPTQDRLEDSNPWFINLTNYGYDVEDSYSNKQLTWVVKGVNKSLINIEIISENNITLLKIIPIRDAYGSNEISIRATDSEGAIVTQKFLINIAPINDPPKWKIIPEIKIHKQINTNVLCVFNYLTDIDNSINELEIYISAVSHNFINTTLDFFGNLNITITDPNHIGSGEIEISVSDELTVVKTKVNLTIQLAQFKVQLLAPENSSIVPTTYPTFYWYLDKPPGLGEVYFDFYLDENEKLVIEHSQKARVSSNVKASRYNHYFFLDENVWYYWTVIPKYYDEKNKLYSGIAVEGVLSFRIDVDYGNQLPHSILLSPKPKEVIQSDIVNLTWLGYDLDGETPITYELYISTIKNDVINHKKEAKVVLSNPTEQFFEFSGLKDNEIYYWTVIPLVNGQRGKCSTSYSIFAVDLSNTLPRTVLLLPVDKVVVPKSPILYWDYYDPDPFEIMYFDIYLSDEKSRLESFNPQTRIATVKDITNYYLPALIPNKEYYWTVISHDSIGPGICECGIWSFIINESSTNHPPIVMLKEPIDQQSISTKNVKLSWNSSDNENDKISYSVYLSDDLESISNLDKSVKLTITTVTTIAISNLTDGTKYYWTVIPNDGKVPGICLDYIWSFEINRGASLDENKENESNPTVHLNFLLILILFLVLFILFSTWIIKKRKEVQLNKIIKSKVDEKLTEEEKTSILSSDTLRAMHVQDKEEIQVIGNEIFNGFDESIIKKSTRPELTARKSKGKVRRRPKIKTRLSYEDESIIKVEKPKPYMSGEYQYTVEESRYGHVAKRYAELVKHAIPYAEGSKKQNHILLKKKLKMAKLIAKKGESKKAIKASSLPITRECPKCGSFKVKTYKNDINKCLDCKFRF